MLELKNISFTAKTESDDRKILDDINLKIDDNKFIVITGSNGAGKSTLAKVIAGVQKPSSGQILLDGEDITDWDITKRSQGGISFAFQQPVKFKGIDVFDLLKIATGKHLPVADACEYLSEVGLCPKDYIFREVNDSLSGGELKRIEIATVLARKSKLTIFDEPEAGIDLWSFQNLTRIFENMQKEINKASIIIISHQERILDIADDIIVMNGGKISEYGSKDTVLPKIMGTEAAIGVCDKLKA